MDDISKIVIRNEDDAFDLLKQLVEGYELDDSVMVEFESWPKFTIRIQGRDFDGTIPTRIMPTLLDLQREVHRTYCLSVYGDENLRRLTKLDREQLELVVKVDKGSSVFETWLRDCFEKILTDAVAKMSPAQLTAVLIIFGVSFTSVLFWKMWLSHKSQERELDQTVQLSRLEKEKMEVVQQAMQKFPLAERATENMANVRNDLLGKLRTEDHLQIPSDPDAKISDTPVEITGREAEEITYTPRERAVERMVSGEFFLRSADFSRPDGIRAEVERVSDGYSFRANIPLGVLAYEQEEALKNNSWERRSVEMALLVKELHGRYTSAKVISVVA